MWLCVLQRYDLANPLCHCYSSATYYVGGFCERFIPLYSVYMYLGAEGCRIVSGQAAPLATCRFYFSALACLWSIFVNYPPNWCNLLSMTSQIIYFPGLFNAKSFAQTSQQIYSSHNLIWYKLLDILFVRMQPCWFNPMGCNPALPDRQTHHIITVRCAQGLS